MTLTTEQIEQVIDDCRKGAAMRGLFNKWIVEEVASELLRCRDRLAELSAQDNREAQPVAGECDREVYENGKSACLVVISKETAEVICRGVSEATGCKVDWHYIGGRVHIKALAPPAPAFPERLPCPVRLMPGLLFGKGVPTESMLDALKRREEYEAELEAMTPAQRAENDARLEKLKALIPQPAPAVPEAISTRQAIVKMESHEPCDSINVAYKLGWNACRAAMLAQPVSGGYKLPEGWISRDERMPKDGDVVLVFQEGGIIFCAEVDDGEFYPDEFPRVPTQGREITHWMPLPAAPEGGK